MAINFMAESRNSLLELARRLPLSSFPPSQRTRIDTKPGRRLLLRQPQSRPALDQPLAPTIAGWHGIVAEEPDDGRHVLQLRFADVSFPIVDARLVHAN